MSGAARGGSRVRQPITTFRVPVERLGFDSRLVASVSVDRRDGLRVRVEVPGAVYLLDQEWDRVRRRRDHGDAQWVNEVPVWLHAVLQHLGLERRVR